MPMLYGHPDDGTAALARMNLGLQKFHYDLPAVKRRAATRAARTITNFKPGVGAHRWQP